MLAKKPVISSSNKIKDPVELSGCGIVVEPESAKSIHKGILYLYNLEDEKRKHLGVKGYDYVKEFHNFSYLSDEYIKLFE